MWGVIMRYNVVKNATEIINNSSYLIKNPNKKIIFNAEIIILIKSKPPKFYAQFIIYFSSILRFPLP